LHCSLPATAVAVAAVVDYERDIDCVSGSASGLSYSGRVHFVMGVLDTLSDALSSGERGANRYRCRDCDRQFAYPAELDEPDCPYCNAPTLESFDAR